MQAVLSADAEALALVQEEARLVAQLEALQEGNGDEEEVARIWTLLEQVSESKQAKDRHGIDDIQSKHRLKIVITCFCPCLTSFLSCVVSPLSFCVPSFWMTR